MGIIRLVGFVLLVLGCVSGITLLIKAVTGKLEDSNTATLWSLFIIGTAAGIIIVATTN